MSLLVSRIPTATTSHGDLDGTRTASLSSTRSTKSSMAMGIDKYNAECRAIVMRCSAEWRRTVERMGRWMDFNNDYKTLNPSFMGTVWWVFKQLWDKDLVYKGVKVMPYSTGLTTPLSTFEAGLDYRDVVDPSVVISFPLIDDPETSLLWTTTPWTVFSNMALDPKKAKFQEITGTEREGPKWVEYKTKAWKVVNDDYVTSDAGTGIVHQAPTFGEDDHRVCVREGVLKEDEMPPCPINETDNFEGQYVKAHSLTLTLSVGVLALLFSTALCRLGSSVPSISTEQLVNNHAETRWVPQSVSDSRFANWLKIARDWNISRNRYWGTPLPLCASEDLEEREVFDCWVESGSMPYAQIHYPFENKEGFNERFPADFIAEGLDQTRGWFYTLLVLATLLFDTAPWKNLIVTCIVLAEDGRKMSKSLKNYPGPNEILARYGADALRRASQETSPVEFTFNVHAKTLENVMDRWILVRCQSLIQLVKTEMEGLIDELTNWYIRFNRLRLKGANGLADTVAALNTLFEGLLTLCRTMSSSTRFLTENIYQGLRPFPPTSQEDIQALEFGNDPRSVHFLSFPHVREEYFDPVIERQVTHMQTVIDPSKRNDTDRRVFKHTWVIAA
ncbi:hypothetical protein BT69DRAFT_1299544 [Atractiella rhizophila]|nr:hypothetical protein BT69DRAFT_1299544 [Atractiella rhizophila]